MTSKAENEVKLKFKINPFMSGRKCAKSMDCDEKTIRNVKKKHGLVSKKGLEDSF